ncbi:MAG: hypothetical protein ACLGIF_10520, partial [Actinomycetes bacterium]
REVEADQHRRVLVSNEFIAGWDESVAQRFLDELGPRTHVVVTVRSVASLLPSLWQQYVKTGYTEHFESFLSRVLADRPDPGTLLRGFDRHDQGGAVVRWAQVAGPERVTVVVADKSEPLRVPAAFEALLDLSGGELAPVSHRGFEVNRSLTLQEAALLLRVNQILAPYEVDEDDLVRILRRGATARVLDECTPDVHQGALALPAWALDRAGEVGTAYADVIARSGVRVIGDLAELRRAPSGGPGHVAMPDLVSTEVAAQAVVGALSAGLARGSNFGRPMAVRRRPGSNAITLSRRAHRVARRLRRLRPSRDSADRIR